jgi:uncharacterized protein YyaL (SSP411 family)
MNFSLFNQANSALIKILFFALLICLSCKNQSQMTVDGPAPNALIHENSPYLLQHAYNPVDWHPWNDEALAKAKRENKLLIISIGYSACHWCHVMEHESFEDSLVASIMNEHFLPIKVDREERPDVDDVYMSAAQLITGRGGWPLNAFAMPDGRPVWAGTYFPKDQWIDILNRFVELKENEPDKLEDSAEQLTSGISSLDAIEIVQTEQEYTPDLVTEISKQFLSNVDMEKGGNQGAPKFPMPNNWEYLLKYADKSGDTYALAAVTTTLDEMGFGGIYDQIGGGFARYSVDGIWKVPHFEKMLYDNSQLVSLYAHAYQKTQKPLYKRIITETLEYIAREMRAPEGGFFSSLDADSEGEEGKFYVWSNEEIDEALKGSPHIDMIKDLYTVSPNGNWEHGNSILHTTLAHHLISEKYNMSEEELYELLPDLKSQLLSYRAQRVRPGLDDKILTSWNALMIQGYINAYRALGDPNYLDEAVRNAHFILDKQMADDGRLNRNYKDGSSKINAFLDDYANLIQALINLYQVTLDQSWLTLSKEMTDYTIEHFYNDQNGMFNYTSDLDAALVAPTIELADNVIPASNSVMARNLNTLGEIYYNKDYQAKAEQMLRNMMPQITGTEQPNFYSNWLQLLFDLAHPPYEMVVIGEDAIALTHELMTTYTGNTLFLGDVQENDLPLLKYKYVPDETKIYVCQNKSCKFPVDEVAKARELMK